jgi:hypothetical protein
MINNQKKMHKIFFKSNKYLLLLNLINGQYHYLQLKKKKISWHRVYSIFINLLIDLLRPIHNFFILGIISKIKSHLLIYFYRSWKINSLKLKKLNTFPFIKMWNTVREYMKSHLMRYLRKLMQYKRCYKKVWKEKNYKFNI